ncbi:eukaryotic translation initiation factor 3 subunit E [Tulasnella sp. 418]|nr:eukaryotic translation initiation factor 3 subunit E [Tulasnella sp. 418]
MAEYDLTAKLIAYLDRHLAIPLLSFLSENDIFPADQIIKAQYELAKETNMVDYYAGLYQQVYPGEDVPEEFAEKRKLAMETNERLEGEAQAVLDVIEKPEVAQALRQDKNQNLQYLKDNYGLTLDQITALYNFGQFQYTYGNYTGAADYLYHFRILSTSTSLLLSAHWGKLASDILGGKWDSALEELNRLKDFIETSGAVSGPPGGTPGSAALAQLQSRTWLLHWSLFVYFNHEQGRTLLLDTFLSPAYLNTIQTSCPWILRYLVAAAIISRKAISTTSTSRTVRTSLSTIVKLVQTEDYQYKDPITDFLKQLYVDFDFEEAQQCLQVAEKVIENDFFLEGFKDEFLENARYVVSEAYCRIHQRIDIAELSKRLNLDPAEGEKWIVNLIRESRSTPGSGASPFSVDTAKIDLEQNVITTSKPTLPVYQTVIERTKGLAFRTQAIGAAMAKRAGGGAENEPAEGGDSGGKGGRGGRREREEKGNTTTPAAA